MTMRSTRPFVVQRIPQNEQPTHSQFGASASKQPPRSTANQSSLGGISFMGGLSTPTGVVVTPKTVDHTAKAKQHGAHEPNTFIPLRESSSCNSRSSCQPVLEVADTARQPGQVRRVQPLLPHTGSYLVVPMVSSTIMPSSSSSQFTSSCSQENHYISCGTKRVQICPKVAHVGAPLVEINQNTGIQSVVKEQPISVPVSCQIPKSSSKRAAPLSRRKQHLVPLHLDPHDTLFDDTAPFHDVQDPELGHDPNREFSFKNSIECRDGLTSSPIKRSNVTSVDNMHQSVLDLSPIRKPHNLTVHPGHDHTPLSFSQSAFNDLTFFTSPREIFPSRAAHPPVKRLYGDCTVDWPHAGETTPMSCLVTDELFLDAVNDSNVFQDISFSCLDDKDLNLSNISASQLLPELQ